MTSLTATELRQASPALDSTSPTALASLTQHNGNLETSFAALWAEQHPSESFSLDPFDVPSRPESEPKRSLLQSTLTVLRQELCGDQGFRGQLDEYRKDPSSAPLLNAAIATVSGLAIANGIPLDGTLAAIVVLYLAKIGLAIICDYTQPAQAEAK